ncbi:hypothetical protein RM844_13905 [Streptomyces sp. DSM 44915]|uniref:Uncharacterized protein n=1 Tax=Streptomyces chisholmiae TaxID=3075540 RepID=A0ABU2JRK5_9ACTN|nr:hypothetical protein [Streptomyces sp. DSM 44915]MDT0267381.1 hypothetical protein [Streptomyces sp. DSM 44915]
MADLSVHALSVAALPHTDYQPLRDFPDTLLPRARRVAAASGIPLDHLLVVTPDDAAEAGGPDVSTLALAALGQPADDEPLFLVRSGPLRDAKVAALAGLVHAFDWTGDDLGLTHLDELGGVLPFDLLRWVLDEDARATALVCDEPLFADARLGMAWFTAIGLRLVRGPGPLTVLGCGEGPPPAEPPDPGPPARYLPGRAPCDSWLALRAALHQGELDAGDRLLIHTRGPRREGWLALEATDPAGVHLPDLP